MTEYIEREKALDCFSRDLGKKDYLASYQGFMTEAASRINDIPAANVRRVVFCKDCMMRQYCKVAQYLGADGFCSNGEKEGGKLMYDDLILRLRDAAKMSEALAVLLPHSEGNATAKLYNEAADAIEELSRLHEAQRQNLITLMNEEFDMEWIPVTERLPEAGKRVLCYCRANIYEVMKMRTNGDWVYGTNHVYMHSFVTHWMPLPEPPKEG